MVLLRYQLKNKDVWLTLYHNRAEFFTVNGTKTYWLYDDLNDLFDQAGYDESEINQLIPMIN